MSQDAQKPQLTKEELNSLREIHIAINWRGFVKGWKKIFQETPFNAHQSIMRKVESVSRKMMTGNASLLGMPVGIILRNTARAMHNAIDGKHYYNSVHVVGFLGACGAVGLGMLAGGPLVAAAVGSGVAGFIGTWGAYATAGIISAAVLPIPAYTASTLISSTLMGAAVAAFSTFVAAPANLFVAFRRSQASMKGTKLTEDQIEALQTEFDRESPTLRFHRSLENRIYNAFIELPENRREDIYKTLAERFGMASQRPQENDGQPACQIQPPAI